MSYFYRLLTDRLKITSKLVSFYWPSVDRLNIMSNIFNQTLTTINMLKIMLRVVLLLLNTGCLHHFFRNACTKSGSLRFSQFSGCWLILSKHWLKELTNEIAPFLTIIWQNSLNIGDITNDWKTTHHVSIYKIGPKYIPENHSSIPLTWSCFKLLDHIVVSSIMTLAIHICREWLTLSSVLEIVHYYDVCPFTIFFSWRRGRMVVRFTTTCAINAFPFTTYVVSSNSGFLRILRIPQPIKLTSTI
jgi:hypothetical protein